MRALNHQSNTLSTVYTKAVPFKCNLRMKSFKSQDLLEIEATKTYKFLYHLSIIKAIRYLS